jgi:hypothetical protein
LCCPGAIVIIYVYFNTNRGDWYESGGFDEET